MITQGAVALGQPTAGTLTGILILTTAVWLGGLVTIFIVARVAQRTLKPAERVAFFRGLGRVYGPVGGLALLVSLGCGAGLLAGRAWNGMLTAAVALAACLLAVTGSGVAQARRMTRLRQAVVASPGDAALTARIRREAIAAAIMRSGIAVLSMALLAVGVLLASWR